VARAHRPAEDLIAGVNLTKTRVRERRKFAWRKQMEQAEAIVPDAAPLATLG